MILHPEDAIVRAPRSRICGPHLYLYHGMVPDTRIGGTFGHEFYGIVGQVGPGFRGDAVALIWPGPRPVGME